MIDKTTLNFIKDHRNDDVKKLALQAKRYVGVDVYFAITQIEGWRHAVKKLPEWAETDGLLYPPRISMEQCSSSKTAKYKAALMNGISFADLTGGFGIDCSYISRNFKTAVYIERNEELCSIATHNFSLLGLNNIVVLNGDCEKRLEELSFKDWIFIDPARRDGVGKKVVALDDCEPNVIALREQLLKKAAKVMIKCSPMLDIAAACKQLVKVSEVHVVAVNNECKELLLIVEPNVNTSPVVHCVNLFDCGMQKYSFNIGDTSVCDYVQKVGRFLYEPNVAIQKAGCPAVLADSYGVKKLHPNSHLYTSDKLVDTFPGRIFEVYDVCGFSKADLKSLVALERANISIRNFPDTVQNLRKRMKLSDGGDIYLFATTLADERKVIIKCKKTKIVYDEL